MKNPKILKKVILFDKPKTEAQGHIGYIQLLSYDEIGKYPHLEFSLDEEHRNKGIMTRRLRMFLESIREEYPEIIAIVKEDNLASAKVLDKLGFYRFAIIGDNYCYLSDLRLPSGTTKKLMEKYNLGLIDK